MTASPDSTTTDPRLVLINESIKTNMHIIQHSMQAMKNSENDMEYLQHSIDRSKQQIKFNLEMKAKWKL